jgi:hypothetical protein
MTDIELVAQLEERSRNHADRVLRLLGVVGVEPFELLIFRGFSSSTTHPTRFDPRCFGASGWHGPFVVLSCCWDL